MYPWRLHKFSLMWPQLYTTKLQDYGYYFTNNPLSCGKKIKKKKQNAFLRINTIQPQSFV